MAHLSDEVKTLIVERLACYDAPKAIIEAVREEFGVTVTAPQVLNYRPRGGRRLAKKWQVLFDAARQKFLDDAGDKWISHKGARLGELQDLYRRAKTAGNLVLARELLEHAAKEMGEAFTNRRVLSPEDPFEALSRELGIPVEELRQAVEQGDDDGVDDDGVGDGGAE